MNRFAHRLCVVALLVLPLLSAVPVGAASAFATPAFQQQWQTGEAITPNFWGPLANARDSQQESYKEAQGGQRLIQYFDKGRMELTNGTLTNGLLTVELMTGKVQLGDATFQQGTPARINIAGDPGNDGITYADLARTPYEQGQAYVCAGTACTKQADTGNPIAPLFQQFIDRVGLATVGLPVTSPFNTTVNIAGVRQQIWAQGFERRVLTLNGNPPNAIVEFGNIGQHYYQWRSGVIGASPAAAPSTSPAIAPTQASITGVAPVFAATAGTLQARGSPAIGLGAATSDAYTEYGIALLQFEHGTMFYLPRLNMFYAIVKPAGPLTAIPRTFGDGGLTTTQMPGPRAGTFIPRLGFGKVWQDNPALQQSLGYATGDEQRYPAQAQTFERGVIVADTIDSSIYVLNTALGIWDGGPA